MTSLLRLFVLWFALTGLALSPVGAQNSSGLSLNQSDAVDPTKPPSSQQTGEPIAPYDDKLLRLSEILGSVHYLRTLCGAKEGNKWRASMSEILAAENPGPKRRSRLIARFNRGYRTFSGTYNSCTASAILASERYMQEGASISKQITNRYGR